MKEGVEDGNVVGFADTVNVKVNLAELGLIILAVDDYIEYLSKGREVLSLDTNKVMSEIRDKLAEAYDNPDAA